MTFRLVGLSLVALLLALLPAAAAPPPVGWRHVGPGGMGAFPTVAADGAALFAGTDLGGLFASADGGETWGPVTSTGPRPLEIHDVAVAGGRLVVAAAEGAFVRDGDDWAPIGVEPASADDQRANGDHFAASVQAIGVAGDVLWLGTGRSVTPRPERLRRHPHQIYAVRETGGPVHAPAGDAPNDVLVAQPSLALGGGTVFSFATSSGWTWAATDVGLYATPDGGKTWVEAGVPSPRFTVDGGASWRPCDGAICPSASASPLPIVASAAPYGTPETHPDLRDVFAAGDRLYVAVADRGVAPADRCPADGRLVDEDLRWYRGGIWASDDHGFTWRWMLTDGGRPLLRDLHYRCAGANGLPGDGPENVTTFARVAANPADPGHVVAGAYGVNGGVLERTGKGWRRADVAWTGLAGSQTGPWVLDLAMTSWAPPTALVSHGRGVSRVTMGTPPSATDLVAGTAADDACALSIAFLPTSAGEPDRMLLGVADGGVLASEDGGRAWTRPSAAWGRGPDAVDGEVAGETYAVVLDPRTPSTVLATYDWGPRATVYRSADDGATWSVIGGDTLAAPDRDGLTAANLVSLAPDAVDPRLVWAASAGDGLWTWDPGRSPPWQPLRCPQGKAGSGEDAGAHEAAAVVSDVLPARDGGVWAAVTHGPDAGVWRVRGDGSCRLVGDVPAPTALARSGDVLVAVTELGEIWKGPPDGASKGGWKRELSAGDAPFSDVTADPSDPRRLVAVQRGVPYIDGYAPRAVWTSSDGGGSWSPEALPDLPTAGMYAWAFGPGGDEYALLSCGSVWAIRSATPATAGTPPP